MMKPIVIVFMLTFTVVVLSVAVFFVEDITSEIIEERQAEEIQEALQSIFPEIDGTTDTLTYVIDADFGISGITQVIEITKDGNPKGYVYTVEFTGFASTITYLMGVDAAGTITGFQVLSQSDTPGYGAQIGDSANWTQFTGMSIEFAGTGNFDGLSGATITTNNWKASMAVVYAYHLETYGYTPLTPQQILQAQKDALAGTPVSSYSNTNPFADYGITAVDTDADTTVVVYTVEFVGYNAADINEYLIAYDLTDNTVLGYQTLYSGDSEDFGYAKMVDSANWPQFDGQTSAAMLDTEVDGFGGASITGNALEASLANVAIYHRWEFEGTKELTAEEQFEALRVELYPEAVRFETVTAFKPADLLISDIYDAYDESDNFLGTIYHVATIGASYSNITYIEYLVGINVDGEYTGFRMVSDTETEGRTTGFYADGYGDTIAGDDITDPVGLDGIADSTLSFTRIVTSMDAIAIYHNEKYVGRPDSVDVDNAELLAAFPTATQFVSVYEDYAYENAIANLYEAQDGTGTVLGYVYYGYASGNAGTVIEYTFGVAVNGTTQQLNIVVDGQTWAGAAGEFGDYDGSEGTVFATSSWLDNFENIDIATILSSPIASVSGVTNTTSGMIDSLEAIATYHADENVGGGN